MIVTVLLLIAELLIATMLIVTMLLLHNVLEIFTMLLLIAKIADCYHCCYS